ncbi:hypothetical protein ZHAS_00015568 [Anopheles sinensis]|uniref:Uncharacterized protein n=1 Tax=Anopheles sinensis TaxID=74873 RepID=A0A084WBK5_ANOSI|nr:hypothetical protein ZHAS_00015568 [Anopheles sinensis]
MQHNPATFPVDGEIDNAYLGLFVVFQKSIRIGFGSEPTLLSSPSGAMPSTRIAVALVISSRFVYCYAYSGICEWRLPDGNAWETVCRNRSGTEQLYPIAFQRPGLMGTDEHDLFRTGGTSYSCLRFVIRCGRVQFELRCKNVSAIYSISPPHPKHGKSDIVLTGTHNFSKPDNCSKKNTKHFYFEGHVSRFVLIRYCINVLYKQESLVGYWLFVSHKNTQQDNEEIVRYVTTKYPMLKPADTNRTAVQLWWNPLKHCNCELYDSYIQRAARCSLPMFISSELNERVLIAPKGESKVPHPNIVGQWFVTIPIQIVTVLLGALLSYLYAKFNDSYVHF